MKNISNQSTFAYPREGPGPPDNASEEDEDGEIQNYEDDSNIDTGGKCPEKSTSSKRASFSFWFTGGSHNKGGTTATKQQQKKRTIKTTNLLETTDHLHLNCDKNKREALRSRPKIRSTSESSALDHILSSSSPVVARHLRGPNRQASKSAIHLGKEADEDVTTATSGLLQPAGNCTFDWWFHRKRRSSKNKSR